MQIVKAKNIDVRQQGDKLLITYPWRSKMTYFLLLFCVIWDLAIFAFLLAGAGWFVIVHLLVGVFMTWYMLTQLFNKTTIEAGGHELRVIHGPVPSFRKDREVPTANVRQLYLSQGGTLTVNGRTTQLWRLMLECADGSKFSLLNGMADKEQARHIEQSVEAHLGITDEPRDERMELPAILGELLPTEAKEQQYITRREAERTPAPPLSSPSVSVPSAEPPPVDGGHFTLRQARQGTTFYYRQEPYTVVENERIDWKDEEQPVAHLLIANGQISRQFYCELLHERWTYFEERPLSQEEREVLGFTPGTDQPYMLRNGDDRYYPGELRRGTYTRSGEEVEQLTYFTIRAATQFRALRKGDRNWHVCVQEPLDDSAFKGAANRP